MGIDWSHIPPGVVLMFVSSLVANAITITGLYFGLKASITSLRHSLTLQALESTRALDGRGVLIMNDVRQTVGGLRDKLITDVNRLDVDLRAFDSRLQSLETGSDEWSKTLRARTHRLSNQVNKLKLKIILLIRDTPGHADYTGSDLNVADDGEND